VWLIGNELQLLGHEVAWLTRVLREVSPMATAQCSATLRRRGGNRVRCLAEDQGSALGRHRAQRETLREIPRTGTMTTIANGDELC
jgi:hypothetical protein